MTKVFWFKTKQKMNFYLKENWQVSLILFFFFIFMFFIIWRLYYLQITKGDYYRKIALQGKNKFNNIHILDRGKIFFNIKDELVPVAIQKYGYKLIINNTKNKFLKNNNQNEVYEKISKIIDIDKESFLKKSGIKNDPYTEITKHLTEDKVEKIKELKIKGMELVRESWRYYPMENIGSKIIGFLNNENQGIYGLEKYYNNQLFRKKTNLNKNIFQDLFQSDINSIFEKKEINRKGDIVTSIDINIQDYLENILRQINKKYKSKKTFGIIMKPATGEIIALGDNELFDFNSTKKDYRNLIVEGRYEPGSIIKPLIVGIALDSKSINKNFRYNDTGCLMVQDKKICNYDKRARGPNTNLTTVIRDSLNVGMVKIGNKIKKDDFLEYFLKFALSEETGIDLPNEISQNISSLDYKIPINYSTAAFGQGISISPIAMIRSLSILANGGYLVNPHIMKRISYIQDIPDKETEIKKEKVLSDKTIFDLEEIMIKAVETSPSKKKYKPKYFTVAAKTGTAQIAGKDGKYKENVNIHTFFGFFPVHKKPEDRYAILLYTIEPRAKYSSQTLTEPFFDLVKYLISYYEIKPDNLK